MSKLVSLILWSDSTFLIEFGVSASSFSLVVAFFLKFANASTYCFTYSSVSSSDRNSAIMSFLAVKGLTFVFSMSSFQSHSFRSFHLQVALVQILRAL